jgi:lipopolysaccharide export system protein LptC
MAEPAETDRDTAPSRPARAKRRLGRRRDRVAPEARPPRLSTRSGYSLFVSTMKVVLPALAVAIVLLVLVWPRIMPDDPRFRVGLSDLSPDAAGSLSMIKPRFQGRDNRDRPFSIVADKATQPEDGANRIDLQNPKADITLADQAWLAVTADSGTYRRDRKLLDLRGHVNLFHDQGFQMQTEATHVDLAAGEARGDTPISVQGPAGHLEAEGFRVLDRGETIIFTGRSKLTVYASQFEDQP